MTRIVGPSLAGAVIGFIGTGETFIIQAAVLVTALYLIATSRFPVVSRPAAIVGNRSMLDGLQLVMRRDDLRGLLLLTSIPSLLVFPYMSFMPVFARDILKIGPTGLGILMGSSGFGAVIGSLMVASSRWRRTSGRWLIVMTIVYGVIVATMTGSRSVFLTCPLLALGSLIGANFMGASNALVQHRVGDEVRGRVMGAYTLTFGLMPLGAMPMGIAADRIGAPGAIAASAILASTLTIGLGILSRTLREL
jgi:MFS transporter, DHA1 family, staphyloferrin A biosynthesis exporter